MISADLSAAAEWPKLAESRPTATLSSRRTREDQYSLERIFSRPGPENRERSDHLYYASSHHAAISIANQFLMQGQYEQATAGGHVNPVGIEAVHEQTI